MSMALSLDAYRQSRGNLTVVVVVDSSQPELPLLFETRSVRWPLRHTVSRGRSGGGATDRRRARRLPCRPRRPEHLGDVSARAASELLRAAEGGLGLVSFDAISPRTRRVVARGRRRRRRRGGEVVTGGTQTLGVTGTTHPITWWQDGERRKTLKVPLPTALARVVDATTLLEDGEGAPMLVARRFGRGKIVQWLVSPKLWRRQYFGHTFGLDDVWLRGITWAARKPFVMKAMPPFVRFRFDDCQGFWRDAKDLRFVDVLNEAGHVPNLSFCIRSLTAAAPRRPRLCMRRARPNSRPHAGPSTSLFYGDEHGEYSPARFTSCSARSTTRSPSSPSGPRASSAITTTAGAPTRFLAWSSAGSPTR